MVAMCSRIIDSSFFSREVDESNDTLSSCSAVECQQEKISPGERTYDGICFGVAIETVPQEPLFQCV